MEDPNELMDLVNGQDEVAGSIIRREIEQLQPGNDRFFRSASVLIMNSAHQLWIPTRQPWREVAPNSLDFSVAERVKSGETYLEAAVRGMDEEVFTKVAPDALHLVTKLGGVTTTTVMGRLYSFSAEEVPAFSHDDYSDAEWLHPAEVVQLIHDGIPAKPHLLDAMEHLALAST